MSASATRHRTQCGVPCSGDTPPLQWVQISPAVHYGGVLFIPAIIEKDTFCRVGSEKTAVNLIVSSSTVTRLYFISVKYPNSVDLFSS